VAAATIVRSAYPSAGQRCTAARRLIVEDGKHDPLVGEVLKLMDRIIVDNPHADPQPFMGPVIDNAAADHVQSQYMELMMKGGKPIRRLERPFEGQSPLHRINLINEIRNLSFPQPGDYSLLVEIDDEPLLATSLTVTT